MRYASEKDFFGHMASYDVNEKTASHALKELIRRKIVEKKGEDMISKNICRRGFMIVVALTALAFMLLAGSADAYPPPAIRKIDGNEQTSEIGNNCWKEENQTVQICSDTFAFITSSEPFLNINTPEPPPKIGAWVYSDSEIENLRFYFEVDPYNRIDRISLVMSTDGWTGSIRSPNVHPIKGWNVVNISGGLNTWD